MATRSTLFVVLGVLLAACSAQPVEHSRESASKARTKVTAHPADDPHWGYESTEGPENWGSLSPSWAICGSGKEQSPIDIENTANANLPALRAEFKPAAIKIIHHEHQADVINTGHSIQVNYTEADSLKVGDEEFPLLQYHFHSPSEHTVGGKRFPMEMHFVHKSSTGKLAVVGVFIEQGAANSAFDPVWSNLPSAKSVEHHLEHVKVDINRLLPVKRTTYRYDGSLTTPPCSEEVKWIIMTEPIELSAQQINAFQRIMKGNNRPVQPLNGRQVVTDRIARTSTN